MTSAGRKPLGKDAPYLGTHSNSLRLRKRKIWFSHPYLEFFKSPKGGITTALDDLEAVLEGAQTRFHWGSQILTRLAATSGPGVERIQDAVTLYHPQQGS